MYSVICGFLLRKPIETNKHEEYLKYYDIHDQDLLLNYYDYLKTKLSSKDKGVLDDFFEHINFTYIFQKIYYKSILVNDLVFVKDLEVSNLELEELKIDNDKKDLEIDLKNIEINLLKSLINKNEYNNLKNSKKRKLDNIDEQLKTYSRKKRTVIRNFNQKILMGTENLKKIASDLKID